MAKRAKKKARTRRPSARRRTGKNTKGRKTSKTRPARKRGPVKAAKARRPKKREKQLVAAVHGRSPRLDRARRVLTDPVPVTSLDVDRFKAAARSGRQALDRSLHEHSGMTPAITGGDVDADWENAYFSGDEAPGGDNLTPDQDNVEEMGEALGLSYEDNEELKGSDKVIERDKHRWELDPASADDYPKDSDSNS
jgi:Family of unknown function (DUF6335)